MKNTNDIIEYNKKLIDKYPWLIPRYVWSGEIVEDYDYTWHELNGMGEGWWKAFGEMLCEEIQIELERCECVNEFRIMQCKEKFAELRIYTGGLPIDCKVGEIIDKYSVLSEHICYMCGKPDVPVTNTGWWLPLCKECFSTPDDYYQKRHTKEEIKNWTEDRSKKWEEICKEEDYKMPDTYTIRRWSKEKDEETIIYNISETATKIRARYKNEKPKGNKNDIS